MKFKPGDIIVTPPLDCDRYNLVEVCRIVSIKERFVHYKLVADIKYYKNKTKLVFPYSDETYSFHPYYLTKCKLHTDEMDNAKVASL